jgi:hypothetical protein
MSARPPDSGKRGRWMDWKPPTAILRDSLETEPTKPSKPGSVGFEGAISGESSNIGPEPEPTDVARASAVLRQAGVRILQLDGVATIGLWSDLDGPAIRAALRVFGSNRMPVRYLDGIGIPMSYKLRRVDGEPVPLNVLVEMERCSTDPWVVRDQMLQDIVWHPKRARQLGRTPAAAVRSGQRSVLPFSRPRAVRVMGEPTAGMVAAR